MQNTKAMNPLLAPILFVILGVGLHLVLVGLSLKAFGAVNDLPEYYAAARLILEGHAAQIYYAPDFFNFQGQLFPELGSRRIPLFLPPLAVPFLIPLAVIPLQAAPLAWLLLLEASFIACLVLLRKHFGLDKAAVLWLVAFSFLSGPAYDAIRIGQIAPLMLLGLCGAIVAWNRGREGIAGACLSVLWVKPQYVLPWLVYLVAARKWRSVAWTIGTGVVLFAAGFALLGVDGFKNYFNLVTDPQSLLYMQPELNPTIRGQLLRFGVPVHIAGYTAIFSLVLACGYLFVLGKRNAASDWLKMALIVMVPLGLVTSFHTHEYDLILLIPGLIALLKTKFTQDAPLSLKLAVVAGFVPFLLPFYADIHYTYLKNASALVNPYFLILFVFCLFLALSAPKISSSDMI